MPRPPEHNYNVFLQAIEASSNLVLQRLADYKTELQSDIQRVAEDINGITTTLEQNHAHTKSGALLDPLSMKGEMLETITDTNMISPIHNPRLIGGQNSKSAAGEESIFPSHCEPQSHGSKKHDISYKESNPIKSLNGLHHFCSAASFKAYHKETTALGYWAYLTQSFVSSTKFEMMMSVVILFNLVLLGMQTQLQGLHMYEQSGLDIGGGQPDEISSRWSDWESFFAVAEYVFNALYVFELFCRAAAFGNLFFKSLFNVVDACVILVNCVECFYLSNVQDRNGNIKLGVFRVFRVMRIFRFAKLLKYMTSHVKEVQLFVRTCLYSFYGVLWCVLIIGIVVAAIAIFLAQVCIELIDDKTIELDRRRWLFESFGTTTRGFFTMFECTFTAHWWHFARETITEVRWTYALFWIPFVLCVNFAMMRIVAALFLKQTLTLAEIDKEKVAMEKMKQKEHFAKQVKAIFVEADLSQDGLLNQQEWDAMLHNPKVIHHFKEMDMELVEVDAVFRVCASDDHLVDFDEFLHSAMKMKGSARTIDIIQIMHKQLTMSRQLADISTMLAQLGCHSKAAKSRALAASAIFR